MHLKPNRPSVRSAHPVVIALLALGLTACQGKTGSAGCRIEGPEALMPAKVKRVRLGMTWAELEAVLGSADYSPADGLFYFSTGGDCPLEDSGRQASCGVVAEFRDDRDDAKAVAATTLRSCRWGAIGE